MVGSLTQWRPRLPKPLNRLEREMEHLMGRFLGSFDGDWDLMEDFSPRTNVAETEEGYEITVELPGMKPEEFNIDLRKHELWINGERKSEEEEKGKTYHRVERRYGEFRRVIPLPSEVDEDKVQAEYHDGVLKVVVPKAETAKPKHIEVKT